MTRDDLHKDMLLGTIELGRNYLRYKKEIRMTDKFNPRDMAQLDNIYKNALSIKNCADCDISDLHFAHLVSCYVPALIEEVKRLREVLEFYANHSWAYQLTCAGYEGGCHYPKGKLVGDVIEDRGMRAREALKTEVV